MPRDSIRKTRKGSIGEKVTVLGFRSPVSGKRCLVLDDEFLIALDIQQILERAGAAGVTCVASAAEAIATINGGQTFDIAVLDVKLSGSDGNSLGVAAALKAKGVPFVFLTGMRVNDVHAKAFLGAPVIEKPYDATILLEALTRLLL